ncbi:MAG: nucleotide exchange factor GrpE [Patescibacteria group bacterium]|nr:nucleotide exchange factor GrpE [Patescibacteria group bacterium]
MKTQEKNKIEELKKQLEELKKIGEEYKNKYLRALADYQNLEKRVKQEKEEMVRRTNQQLIIKILPIIDDLEKAAIFVKDEGLKIIKNKMIQFLKNEGVEEIDVLNKTFDPYLCEAVEIVKGEEDDKVVAVIKKGYRQGEKILRVAQVKVMKKN